MSEIGVDDRTSSYSAYVANIAAFFYVFPTILQLVYSQ